ncbi:hypothetical protein Pla22_25170 [Rubripirellula amarantea]|uniref:Uncharacterized protein n=2 Tax=Rubripirellula amarantea TaxID=2527999 RepID=A0A5C5WXY3_9BACT|nr:hypothetical protein Pla22_25170 [Rubripirellula amarantea]
MEGVETVYRDKSTGDEVSDLCELLRRVVAMDPDVADFQLPSAGVGKIFNRKYHLLFDSESSAEEIIANVQAFPGRYCDPRLAEFNKTRGEEGQMAVGDRYHISISGPWDGPVETIAIDERSFTFITLDGHLEAGFIRFSANPVKDTIEFRIESWAASAGPMVWFTYSGLKITEKMQTKMWRHYCLKIAAVTGKNVIGPLHISTICLGEASKLGMCGE